MRRSTTFAIAALIGLPIMSLIIFPIILSAIESYIEYLEWLPRSSSYALEKVDPSDIENPGFHTLTKFHSVTDRDLKQYPQLSEALKYLHNNSTAAPDPDTASIWKGCYRTNPQDENDNRTHCQLGFDVKNTRVDEFRRDMEIYSCCGYLEVKGEGYYFIGLASATDKVSSDYRFMYSLFVIPIGSAIIILLWVSHNRW